MWDSVGSADVSAPWSRLLIAMLSFLGGADFGLVTSQWLIVLTILDVKFGTSDEAQNGIDGERIQHR